VTRKEKATEMNVWKDFSYLIWCYFGCQSIVEFYIGHIITTMNTSVHGLYLQEYCQKL